MKNFVNRKCILNLSLLCIISILAMGCKPLSNIGLGPNPIIQALDQEISVKNYSITNPQIITNSRDGSITMEAPQEWFDATYEKFFNLSPDTEASLLNIASNMGSDTINFKMYMEKLPRNAFKDLSNADKVSFADNAINEMELGMQMMGGTLTIRDKKIFDNAIMITGNINMLGVQTKCIYIYLIKNGYAHYIYGAATNQNSYNDVISIIKSIKVESKPFYEYFQ